MKQTGNKAFISFTMVLVLLAAAQQPGRAFRPAPRAPARHTTLPRIPGFAPQIPTQLAGQSSTVLPDGSLLVLGGSSVAGAVSLALLNGAALHSSLLHARAWHTATVLPDGTALIAGGIDASGTVTASEIFEPVKRSFADAAIASPAPRAYHTATLLTDGRVLIAGGIDRTGKAVGPVELWDPAAGKVQALTSHLAQPRRGHSATLQADGTVRMEGGTLDNGSAATAVEIFDPVTQGIAFAAATGLPASTLPASTTAPSVAGSIPYKGATNVDPDSLVSLRFSRSADLKSVTAATITLRSQKGSVPAQITGAEGGMLAFVNAQGGLQPDSVYTVSLHGVTDKAGLPITPADITFSTAPAGGPNASAGGKTPSAQDDPPVPPLQAGAGVTAVSGSVRTADGKYLPGVTLTLDCGDGSKDRKTMTDATGRFLLASAPPGHCELQIDGTTVHRGSDSYGIFTPGLDLKAGVTNVLPYTIWMTPLDTAHAINLPSPTTRDMVVTNPAIPNLELHLAAGTAIKDYDGKAVTRLTITRIPLARPPFPLPAGVNVPFYFTIQPGGAHIEVNGKPGGAQLYYPNQNRAPPGFRFDFWDYEPSGKGWYTYGYGTVDAARRYIVPNAATQIYEFSGAMVGGSGLGGSGGPTVGGSRAGDPVDLGTGIFTYQHTDLALPDVLPVSLTRSYRQWDSLPRAFGVGMGHNLDTFIVGNTFPYTYIDLIRGDGSRVHFNRTSPGTGSSDAVYQAQSDPAYLGSQIFWDGVGWTLTLKDGTAWKFPESFQATLATLCAITSVTDRHGNKITFTRDSSGNLQQVTTPNGRWLAFTYDSSGRITRATDNGGRSVTYQYDVYGRLSQVTNALGGVTTYSYDANNLLLTIEDARGIDYIANQYDSQNRVVQQTMADGGVWQYGYTQDGSGNVIQTNVKDPRGKIESVTFNTSSYFGGGKTTGDTYAYGTSAQQTYTRSLQSGTNLVLSVTDPLSRVTAFTYDGNGNPLTVTRASGTSSAATTTLTYDATFNQLTSVSDPLSHTTTLTLNSTGDVTAVTDALSHQATLTYNTSGQLLTSTTTAGTTSYTYSGGDLAATTDPLGNTWRTSVDTLGRAVSVADPLNNQTHFSYDALNNLVQSTDALNNVTTFVYDANSNPTSLTDAAQNTTRWTWDSMDQAVSRTDPLSHTENYHHDLNGNVAVFSDRKSQATQSSFDDLDRLSGQTFADSSTVSYTYDADDRVTQIVDSAAGTITRTYDLFDRLTNETTPQGSVSYTYDGAGRRASMTVYGQSAINYTWDNGNRLTQIAQGTATVAIAYDSANRRTSVTLPNGVVAAYGYDAASQLTSIGYTNGSATIGNLTYTYDGGGRRTSVGGTLAAVNLPSALSSATYNVANQLTQWGTTALTYDLNGNLNGDGVSSYSWDARNRLSSVGSSSFSYDALGRRIQNATGTGFLYDGANAVQELSGSSVTANLVTGAGVDEVFSRTDSSGTGYVLSDALGSTVGLATSGGTMQTQYSYEPFGKTTASGTSSTNRFEFTGRENDGTGLYYYRARYYSPSLQRFISEDPLGYSGSGANLYEYAGSSVPNLRDPSGMSAFPIMSSSIGLSRLGTRKALVAAAPIIFGQIARAVRAASMLPGPLMLPIEGIGLPLAESGAGAADAAENVVGAISPAPRMTADQEALKDLVEDVTNGARKPLSVEDANTVNGWAQEYDYPGFRAGPRDVSSPSNWPGRGGQPHIHMKGIGSGHIPVLPGVTPVVP